VEHPQVEPKQPLSDRIAFGLVADEQPAELLPGGRIVRPVSVGLLRSGFGPPAAAAHTLRTVNPAEFAAKWTGSTGSERAASQEHFIDLCRMLGVPTPNEADPSGETFAFEKGAEKTSGGGGFADVWKRWLLRLGVQGQEEGPEGCVRPAPPVPRGPGEPSPPRRLRPRPVPGAHELHRHGCSDRLPGRLEDGESLVARARGSPCATTSPEL